VGKTDTSHPLVLIFGERPIDRRRSPQIDRYDGVFKVNAGALAEMGCHGAGDGARLPTHRVRAETSGR
jgi:hypothetical protein